MNRTIKDVFLCIDANTFRQKLSILSILGIFLFGYFCGKLRQNVYLASFLFLDFFVILYSASLLEFTSCPYTFFAKIFNSSRNSASDSSRNSSRDSIHFLIFPQLSVYIYVLYLKILLCLQNLLLVSSLISLGLSRDALFQ